MYNFLSLPNDLFYFINLKTASVLELTKAWGVGIHIIMFTAETFVFLKIKFILKDAVTCSVCKLNVRTIFFIQLIVHEKTIR